MVSNLSNYAVLEDDDFLTVDDSRKAMSDNYDCFRAGLDQPINSLLNLKLDYVDNYNLEL
jgi:hypothetical protein